MSAEYDWYDVEVAIVATAKVTARTYAMSPEHAVERVEALGADALDFDFEDFLDVADCKVEVVKDRVEAA